MKCYQIDWSDGNRDLIDANSKIRAIQYAIEQGMVRYRNVFEDRPTIVSCVCVNTFRHTDEGRGDLCP